MLNPRRSGPSVALVLAFAAGLAACASTPPPNAELGAARAAIENAERSGAAELAPVELNNARAKLNRAEGAARQSEHQTALWLAEEAQVDAEVAGARAQARTAQQALKEIREGTRALGSELQQPATSQ